MSTNRLSPARKKRYYKREYFKEFKEILRLLKDNSKDKINVNEIVRIIEEKYKGKKRTGLKNKPNIINAIEKLKEAGLVKKEKQGKQKELVVLTPIGEEIAEFITAIEKYNLSYFNLLKTIHEKVSFVLGRDLVYIEIDVDELDHATSEIQMKEEVINMRLKLIDNGWKKEEIKFYNKIRNTLIDFKVICDNNFMNILLNRYSRIIKIHNEKMEIALFMSPMMVMSVMNHLNVMPVKLG